MILYGKLVCDTRIIKEASYEVSDQQGSFRDRLEECLIGLCRALEISVPVWLKKNTAEFVQFQKTFFTDEQFVDKIMFDRFEIRTR